MNDSQRSPTAVSLTLTCFGYRSRFVVSDKSDSILAARCRVYGDDEADSPLVFHWTGSDSTFRDTIVGAVEWLLGGVQFDRVHLEVDTDPWGFIQTVTPEAYEDLTIGVSGEELEFTITLDGVVPALPDDAIYPVTLNVYGDDTTLLATEPLIIVVPGIF